MARARITEMKEGRVIFAKISPPMNGSDLVLEVHQYERERPLIRQVLFLVISREEFSALAKDMREFETEIQ
jgi:hypothetical protein